tara:strand:- start:8 stop:187 length:180 start_codon:yes stop_codon:yes gene_type:complete
MDNLSSHKTASVPKKVGQIGVKVWFLSPPSPDLNLYRIDLIKDQVPSTQDRRSLRAKTL